MIDNIEVNTQNSIRIASRVAIQPDTVENLGVNGISNGFFRKYDIMI